MFELVTYANNYGDNLNKNILKTLLGKIFKDNEQAKQALEIYKSQITYFAKEKITTGALLSWYLIADATIDVQGPVLLNNWAKRKGFDNNPTMTY